MSEPKMKSMIMNPFQRELLLRFISKKPEDSIIACRCGWGAGKTAGLLLCLLVRSVSHPEERSLLITDTHTRLLTVIFPLLDEWILPLGWRWDGGKSTLIAPTGHHVICRSWFNTTTSTKTTSNPLEGINCSAVFIDEAQVFNNVVFNKAIGRIRSGSDSKVVMVGLPLFDAWWVKIAEDNGSKPIFYSSYVNKGNLSSNWFDAIKTLPASERQAMVENNPLPPTGSVYSSFNPHLHVIDYKPNPDEETILSMDFGFRSPIIQLWQFSSERQAWVLVFESVKEEQKVSDLIKLLSSIAVNRQTYLQNPHLYPNHFVIDSFVGDKAGAARSDRTAQSTFLEIGEAIGIKAKWTTDAVRTNVLNGVKKCIALIESHKVLVATNVYDSGRDLPKSFRQSVQNYRWKEGGDDIVKDDISDHAMDAFRYFVINRLWRDTGKGITGIGKSHGAFSTLALPTAPAPVHKPKPTTSMPYMPPTALPNKKRLSF